LQSHLAQMTIQTTACKVKKPHPQVKSPGFGARISDLERF
jgi:hypothetical protein